MTTVLAQGTFDLLHPGHVHYLREAAEMGDELHVIIARSGNVSHKEDPVLPAEQRRDVVAGLEPVDEAVLGHPEDIFVPLEAIQPDVVVLGHDQFHDDEALAATLAEHGHDCEVRRASAYDPGYDGAVLSSSAIVERILDRRHDQAASRMRPPAIRDHPL